MHGKYGQTIGKKLVSIKIHKTNNEEIGWKEAWLRSIVDISISSISLLLYITTILKLSVNNNLYLYEIREYCNLSYKGFSDIFSTIILIWMLSEVITMLFNKRKRAVHDFIAGTIVIRKKERKSGIIFKLVRIIILILLTLFSSLLIFMDFNFEKQRVEFIATGNDRVEIQNFIKTNKYNINDKTIMGRNFLYFTAKRNNYYFCKLLIENKIDVNTQDLLGDTPLHKAVDTGNIKIVKLLVDNGANIHLKNSIEEKPCDTIGFLNDLSEIKKYLIKKGDKNCKNLDE